MNLIPVLRIRKRLLLICPALISLQQGYSQQSVSGIYTHTINATSAIAYTGTGATGNVGSGLTGNTYTYQFGTNVATSNNMQILDSFISASFTYHYQPVSETVKFQRVNNATVSGARKSMWFDENGGTVNAGGTADLYADYDDSLERVFTERLFDVGIDNVFQNATTTNNNNIERMDVIFSSALYSTDNTKAGFVVFDRGAAGSHDPFYIAAITALDASGNPSAYDNAVLVPATAYGSSIGGNVTYLILRKNPTDARLLIMENSAAQNRDGVFLRFSDLGVASNTKIFGYSLMGTDVVVSPATNMVSYTNASFFPTTSDYGTIGGLDPLAVTGLWTTTAGVIILPDWFGAFSAHHVSGGIALNWGLGAADNLKELIVERSGDGIAYVPLIAYPFEGQSSAGIGSPQQGNLPIAGPPNFTLDEHPLPGKNYYRLSLINHDGQITAYSPVQMAEAPVRDPVTMTIWPNPVQNGQVSIEINGPDEQSYYLRLFDGSGRPIGKYTLYRTGAKIQKTVSLPGYSKGMYFVQLLDKKGNKILTRKIAVE